MVKIEDDRWDLPVIAASKFLMRTCTFQKGPQTFKEFTEAGSVTSMSHGTLQDNLARVINLCEGTGSKPVRRAPDHPRARGGAASSCAPASGERGEDEPTATSLASRLRRCFTAAMSPANCGELPRSCVCAPARAAARRADHDIPSEVLRAGRGRAEPGEGEQGTGGCEHVDTHVIASAEIYTRGTPRYAVGINTKLI